MKGFVLAAALSVAGCATVHPEVYARIDGHPIDPSTMETDQTICKGEVGKADMTAAAAPDTFSSTLRKYEAEDTIMHGCMAQRGPVKGREY